MATKYKLPQFLLADRWGILVLSQAMAMGFKPPVQAALIRIRGHNPTGKTDFESLVYEHHYAEVLKLHFDDVDYRVESHNKVIGRTEAEQIVNFFERHKDTPLIVVHCQGGISRSSAVGCALAYWQGQREAEEEMRQSGCFVPNARVYRTLVDEIERRKAQVN